MGRIGRAMLGVLISASMVGGALGAVGGATAPAMAQEQSSGEKGSMFEPVVRQGYPVYIDDGLRSGGCTVGYNDRARGISYVSAHCSDGKVATVSLPDPLYDGEVYRNVGVIYPAPNYRGRPQDGDWACIRWNSDVRKEPNTFSSDNKIHMRAVRKGDKVCARGVTSHLESNGIGCGWFENVNDSGSVTYIDPFSRPGDSGGPVWVERDGKRYFLGLLSGKMTWPGKHGTTYHMEVAAIPDVLRRLIHGALQRVSSAVDGLSRPSWPWAWHLVLNG